MTTAAKPDTAAADAAAAAATAAAATAAADKATADKTAADKAAADLAAGTKPKDGEAVKEGDTTGTEGAPEKYALTIPEGGAVDATDVAEIEKMAREHKLPNEAAQALLEQQNTYLIQRSEALAAQLEGDTDYGGAKLVETQRLARLAINAVRPEGHPRRAAFQRILDKSGYGNHVEVASFFADLGKKLAEDTPVSGSGGGEDRSQVPLEKRLFPGYK